MQKDLTYSGVLKYLDGIWEVIYMPLQKYYQAMGVFILISRTTSESLFKAS